MDERGTPGESWRKPTVSLALFSQPQLLSFGLTGTLFLLSTAATISYYIVSYLTFYILTHIGLSLHFCHQNNTLSFPALFRRHQIIDDYCFPLSDTGQNRNTNGCLLASPPMRTCAAVSRRGYWRCGKARLSSEALSHDCFRCQHSTLDRLARHTHTLSRGCCLLWAMTAN